jgi:hypothetical protein
MIEVSRLKDLNAAKLFLGFRIGAISRRDFAVFPVQGQRSLRRLKSQDRSQDVVIIWRGPPAIREAVARIFVQPARGLYDTIKGDMLKHDNFSHD